VDAETPSRGRDMMEMDQGHCTRDEEDVPFLSGTLALGGLGRHHLDHDITQHHGRLGRQTRQQWHVWKVGEAQGGLTFFSRMPHLP
jgi:hypothetical protein